MDCHGGRLPVPELASPRGLLIDDDPAALGLVWFALTLAGLLVVGEAADASVAMRARDRCLPTVAVVSLQLARSGPYGLLTLLADIREQDRDLRVVVHTDVASPAVLGVAYDVGAFAVRAKGGPFDGLVSAVWTAHVAGRRPDSAERGPGGYGVV